MVLGFSKAHKSNKFLHNRQAMSKIKTSIEQMPLKKIKFSANSDSVLIGVEIDHVLDNREEMQTNRDNNIFESLVVHSNTQLRLE